VLAGNPDLLPDELPSPLEDGVGAPADVFHRDAGQLLVIHGEDQRQRSIRSALGTGTEVDQVVPVERGQEPGGGHAGFPE
jgi:hypothetical protein